MTEYATTPSAIEEWKAQRSRTADWVQHFASPGLPPTPEGDSDSEKRSLWDGSGWEPPSDCESSTSVPPTMMLKYPDSRQVLVSPTTSHLDGSNARSHTASHHSHHSHRPVQRRDEERTERARSMRPTEHAPSGTIQRSLIPSQTSSMRLARAAAAPLPDSKSSSSGSGSRGINSTSRNSAHSSSAIASASHPSRVQSNHPSHPPSHHPSHPPSHHPSHVPSHQPSHTPSHQPSHVPSHQPSHIPSYHQQPIHPPSAFSNHTIVASPSGPPPPGSAAVTPPSIHSIHSRSISLADSRSSGPPEPIIVHPPSAIASSRSRSNAGPSPTHSHPPPPSPGHASSFPPAANVLPAASASMSYYSVPRQSQVYEQQRQSVVPNHKTSQVHLQENGQLPTPISPNPHSSSQMPMRNPSTVSATGLDGGFVLVDAPSPGYEYELERELAGKKKGSFGDKSTASQRRERGSLFNVFGGSGGRPGGHTRSRSLPMTGMDVLAERHQEAAPNPVSSPQAYYQSQQIPNHSNPYLTPISPLSPVSPADPIRGPHPPPIVYAPARHHRATHYSPPQIVYIPSSPRGQGQRQVPYDTQQFLRAQGQSPVQGYPQHAAPAGATAGYSQAAIHPGNAVEHSPRSVRRSKTLQETAVVRDSGWDDGKQEGQSPERRGDNVQGHTPTPSVHANTNPISPTASHATVPADTDAAHVTSVQSEATSAGTNMAGVGTVSGRSRSRGRRTSLEDIREGGSERSRSRARGMVYSASAPQPQGSVTPHAAMMVPPASTGRDRGVRETPYPTPPGSVNEYLNQQNQRLSLHQHHQSPLSAGPNGHGSRHQSSHSLALPTMNEIAAPPNPGGLISRFRDIYHSSHGASPSGNVKDSSPTNSISRGRARERRKKDDSQRRLRVQGQGQGRAHSVDSQASCSSASTYYVIPTPGQKVRIIHANGQATTTTTSFSRNNSSGGGWFKKAAALRPRFMHRDHTREEGQGQQPSPNSERARAQAPAMDDSRTSSRTGSARKTGRKLVRRNSTGSAALLSVGAPPATSNGRGRNTGAARDVDIVYPGR